CIIYYLCIQYCYILISLLQICYAFIISNLISAVNPNFSHPPYFVNFIYSFFCYLPLYFTLYTVFLLFFFFLCIFYTFCLLCIFIFFFFIFLFLIFFSFIPTLFVKYISTKMQYFL